MFRDPPDRYQSLYNTVPIEAKTHSSVKLFPRHTVVALLFLFGRPAFPLLSVHALHDILPPGSAGSELVPLSVSDHGSSSAEDPDERLRLDRKKTRRHETR